MYGSGLNWTKLDKNRLKWTEIDQNGRLLWLNKSVMTVNTILQLLDIIYRYKYIDVMFTGIRGFKFQNDVLEFTTTRYIQSSKPRIQMTMNIHH